MDQKQKADFELFKREWEKEKAAKKAYEERNEAGAVEKFAGAVGKAADEGVHLGLTVTKGILRTITLGAFSRPK